MPAVYQKSDVRFLYPENWQVTEEETEAWPRSITLQSEQSAFFTLHIYPPATELRPVVKEIVDTMREEFPDLEVLPAKEAIGTVNTKGVDICFFYLDLMVEAKIRTVKTPSLTLVWHCQAESREYTKMEPVFNAMAISLLEGQVPLPE